MTIQPYEPHPGHLPATDSWVPILESVASLAGKLAQTPFVPKAMRREPASVAAAILTGREMNLGPMASLRGIDVIEGRPSLTAQMLAARIFAAGHSIEWIASTDKQCTVRITRGDGLSNAEATWTMGDAQRAGLTRKQVWQAYPRHMLRARALSECAAMACPDVALGLDVTADTEAQERPSQASGVSVVQLSAPDPEPPVQAATAATAAAIGPPPAATEQRTGEPTADAPTEPAEPLGPELLSNAQMRKIGAQIGELERLDGRRLDRAERRAFIGGLAGVEDLASAKDLTKEQASRVIEELDRAIGAALTPQDAELVPEEDGSANG